MHFAPAPWSQTAEGCANVHSELGTKMPVCQGRGRQRAALPRLLNCKRDKKAKARVAPCLLTCLLGEPARTTSCLPEASGRPPGAREELASEGSTSTSGSSLSCRCVASWLEGSTSSNDSSFSCHCVRSKLA